MQRQKASLRPQATAKGGVARFAYYGAKAITNLKANRLVTLITMSTITLALLIISLFMLIYLNLEGTVEKWSSKVSVSVYFDKEPTPQELSSLKTRIAAIPGTEEIRYVTRDEALKRFRTTLKGQESLLDGITHEVLPSSLEITLKKELRSSESISFYAGRLKHLQGIGEVQYGEEWVKKFLAFFQLIRLAGLMIALFLVFAVLFIVANTIKLTVLARRDEIEVMALVGATPFFIKAPFLIEGMIQGGAGAVFSTIILSSGYYLLIWNAAGFLPFNPAETTLVFLSVAHIAAIIFGGVLLGFIGSLVSLKKQIVI